MDTDTFDLDCQHSRFPIPSSRLTQDIKLVPLEAHCNIDHKVVGDDSLLLRAWAMLLHAYVRQESVCFITLPPLISTHELGWADPQYASAGCCELTIARYHVGTSSTGKKGTFDYRACGRSYLQSGRCNTGLVFSDIDPTGYGLNGDAEILSVMAQFGQNLSQLDLILYIARKQSKMFLLFRHPSISYNFANSIRDTFQYAWDSSSSSETQFLDGLAVQAPSEVRQMLAWNPLEPYSTRKAACLHHLVEQVARQLPEAESICAWDGSLTYRALNALADSAAQRLRQSGVKAGVYVPFAYEKSMWTIVACLGILKAGGAIVPISVQEPDTRLLAILKSIDARVLVTSRGFEAKFRAFVVNIVVLDESTMDAASQGSQVVDEHSKTWDISDLERLDYPREVEPVDPVFVLFTSGSTGQPKGMIHNHESICTQWLQQGRVLGYQGARVLQFAAHTFDVFIIDVFTALLYGGCVCIPSESDRQNNIVGIINQMKIDYATLTPSFAGLIEPSEVPTLTTVCVGGEALPQDRVRKWAEKVRFIQIYGPAEVGICLAMEMKPDTPPEAVGFPLPNCSCWLVDPSDSDCLVPIGATGELVVAGPSLAMGYLNDEVKTKMCFLEAPSWAQTTGLRSTGYYKTGDLLRLNTDRFDGSFDFVGRKDSQIKLRGQRIEPGEVEYHLGNIPGIAHAMVTMPESGSYAGQLVAVVQTCIDQGYFQKHGGCQISISTKPSLSLPIVQERLAQYVPVYMIPSVYLEVDALPCVASMKIDRRLVRSWLDNFVGAPALFMVEQFPIIAEDGTARYLSQAVSDMLERKEGDQYRLNSKPRDFILQDIGLDSVQVISLAMLIRKKFGVKVPAAKLLDPVTSIRDLAAFVDFYRVQSDGGLSIHTNQTGRKSFDLLQEVENLCSKLKRSQQHFNPCALELLTVHKTQYHPRNIFLTGATGFLGLAILHHLLEHFPDTKIYTLVRCSSENTGLLRLLQALNSQGRWQAAYLSRLFVIPGDLSLENLGISSQNMSMLQLGSFESLGSSTTSTSATVRSTKLVEIDAIIHAGAKVHYSTCYSALKQTNTLSVLTLLSSFIHVPSMRRFIYVSGGEFPHTLSSLTDSHYVRAIEADANGYTQSKVVGEQLVHFAAVERDLIRQEKSVRIVKPGYIIGNSETGVANQSDFLWRLVRGCIEIRGYDASAVRKWVFLGDVEHIASLVLGDLNDCGKSSAAEGIENSNLVERVLCGVWFEDIWDILKDEFGYTLEGMETEAWMECLVNVVEEMGEEHLLFPLLDTLEKEGKTVGIDWQPTGSDDARGKVKDAIRQNVEYLIGIGFLPATGREGTSQRISNGMGKAI
ncbi:MAG: hypothetical protein LQ349_003701 [Xanthoria aureola]|nr:MAG: hypothetical protein LQ349_003701 [Xanthoria aureola]